MALHRGRTGVCGRRLLCLLLSPQDFRALSDFVVKNQLAEPGRQVWLLDCLVSVGRTARAPLCTQMGNVLEEHLAPSRCCGNRASGVPRWGWAQCHGEALTDASMKWESWGHGRGTMAAKARSGRDHEVHETVLDVLGPEQKDGQRETLGAAGVRLGTLWGPKQQKRWRGHMHHGELRQPRQILGLWRDDLL